MTSVGFTRCMKLLSGEYVRFCICNSCTDSLQLFIRNDVVFLNQELTLKHSNVHILDDEWRIYKHLHQESTPIANTIVKVEY